MDIQERLTAFASLGAEWVMWVLVALSVVSVAIVLERAYFLLAARDDAAGLRDELRTLLSGGKLDAAKKRLASSKSFEAAIVQAGIEAAEMGAESVEERMAGEAAIAKARMERNLSFLGTVGNNAPFVGLLGTVIGVINAFRKLDTSTGQVSESVMTEIGEALVATAIGLLVAIPAVAFFNFYQRVVKSRLTWADAMGRDLMAHMRADGRSERD